MDRQSIEHGCPRHTPAYREKIISTGRKLRCQILCLKLKVFLYGSVFHCSVTHYALMFWRNISCFPYEPKFNPQLSLIKVWSRNINFFIAGNEEERQYRVGVCSLAYFAREQTRVCHRARVMQGAKERSKVPTAVDCWQKWSVQVSYRDVSID